MLKALIMAGLIATAAAPTPDLHPAKLIGDYDGGQMEMAVGLSLKANGRFEYGLSYGALDEEAAGTWAANGNQVLLTSDPVTPPRFSVIGQKPAAAGALRITLDLPGQINRQLFDAHVLLADGRTVDQQLGDDGVSIPFAAGNPPVKIALSFDVFELASDPVTIDPARGYEIDFRFDPNDLGKVDFKATPLKRAGDDLLLERYGRSIRFRRVAKR
ncbi:hypothetical protein [Sphingomonas bacterium]|uniref:hypothetical protein n=1 Tax=Sphingomonas bacterium TaxID=1895847 RepID=UPI00261FB47F|nr:hypothetical protein [Sphingomonas bacterium]MDB5679174.1 hypothetical protein [Sphingomonas bacterium]